MRAHMHAAVPPPKIYCYGQNILLWQFQWLKCPGRNIRGRNVRSGNVQAETSVAEMSVVEMSVAEMSEHHINTTLLNKDIYYVELNHNRIDFC